MSDIFTSAGLPDDLLDDLEIIDREQTELRVTTDSRRYGKLMTLVHGFTGDKADGKKLLTQLKSKCACGGAFKEGVIELQGDHTKKVVELLQQKGYMVRAD